MKNISILTIILFVLPYCMTAQTIQPSDTVRSAATLYRIPLDENPMIYEAGLGFGVPYGITGFQGAVGNAHFSGNFAVGVVPLGGGFVYTLGGTIHFLKRYSVVHPRLTILYTNTAAYNFLVYSGPIDIPINLQFEKQQIRAEQSTHHQLQPTTSVADTTPEFTYRESFPGIAIMGGIDIRCGTLSHFFLNLNVGFVTTFVGDDEVTRRYKRQQARIGSNYDILDLALSTYGTVINYSLGVNYIIGRTLEEQGK